MKAMRHKKLIIFILLVIAVCTVVILCYRTAQNNLQERTIGVYIVDSSRYNEGLLSVTVPDSEDSERVYTADVRQCDRIAIDGYMYFVLTEPFDPKEETMIVERILPLTL